jgi:hypothetical protein
MAKIFFHKFDSDRINEGGWSSPYGDLYLRLTNYTGDGIKALDEAMDEGVYEYVGEIDVKTQDEAFAKVQNIDIAHPLDNRSMMKGDVVIINGKGYFCENIGWSKLSSEQVTRLLALQS